MKLPRARSAPNQCRFSHHLFHLSQSVQEYTHIQSNMPLSIKKDKLAPHLFYIRFSLVENSRSSASAEMVISNTVCAKREFNFHSLPPRQGKGRRRKHIGGIKCNPFSQGKARTISNLHFASWACL
jgi:hypothetical protein